MIKKASLEDELFLVLLLKGEVLKYSKEIQRTIANHYNVYEDGIYPELHITIDRIKKQDLERSINILEEVLLNLNLERVEIELDKFVCYRGYEDNFLVLKIKETPSLMKLAKSIHHSLVDEGISVIKDYEDWQFHITILSNIFASNPVTDLNFDSLCFFLEGKEQDHTSYSDRLEIWSPTLDPTKKCLASFQIGKC
ncbi:MAG: 2'-5' RNA ligase family protein [bacterium]